MLFAQREAYLAFSETDSLYREDQFYVAATFHLIENRPAAINQSGFSGGVHFGFIRDMPFTKRRNWALGLGLGYSANIYNQNLLISKENKGTEFKPIEIDDELDRNRFVTHLVEVPLELRWRTSNSEVYKFWRIYGGMRFGYMHYFNAKFDSESGNKIRVRKPDGLDRLRLGATLTFGWNTFNFHVYYSLNDLFDKTASITNKQGGLSVIKLGLMFYIL